MADATILIVGTCDTKLDEILYLREQIHTKSQCATLILDVAHSSQNNEKYLSLKDEIIHPLQDRSSELAKLERGQYIEKAIELCTPVVKELVSKFKVQGIVSAAGSSGSSLACALMRKACPIGFPKLMVSTMASGDIKPYIEETDITMMYSVVDIAGMNSILRSILGNAAAAISAMTSSYTKAFTAVSPSTKSAVGKRIAVTMFGVTTPCVDHIRQMLAVPPPDTEPFEIYVFHATGAGGRAMERLIAEGQIDGVIDLTTTEIADELFGGVLTAGPDRLEVAAKRGIPMVVSVGACDMVNFGAPDTVPDRYRDRTLYHHNPAVTLMRTTKENNAQIGQFIASQLKNNAKDPDKIRVLIPEGGVSMIDVPDKPFHDPEADAALFEAIGTELEGTEIVVEKYPENINDAKFAAQCCRVLLEMIGTDTRNFRLANARRRRWSFDHGMNVMRRSSEIERAEVSHITNFALSNRV